MFKEYKVEIRLHGTDWFDDLYYPDGSREIVKPFKTKEMAKMMGEHYVKEHLDLYKKLQDMGNRWAGYHNIEEMRIVEREISDWKEIENAVITL